MKEYQDINERINKYFNHKPEKIKYIKGRCKICGSKDLLLIVDCGQYSLRCLKNLQHVNIEGLI